MQTIGIIANCISKEKQGINILAYLQWQIDDFAIAYKKLYFTESLDPLEIINAQLREQAEAAIKDKIATMSVEGILTDKAPIIKELTGRLKKIAEGQQIDGSENKDGLVIKISTVQIREAIVSSETLCTDCKAHLETNNAKNRILAILKPKMKLNKKNLMLIYLLKLDRQIPI